MRHLVFDKIYCKNHRPYHDEDFWFYSIEKAKSVPNGTVRRIRGHLFYSEVLNHFDLEIFYFKPAIVWRPVDDDLNEANFWKRILE